MATNSLQSLQTHHSFHQNSLLKSHETPPTTLPSSFPLKSTITNINTTNPLFHTMSSSSSVFTCSVSPITSSTPSTSQAISFDLLQTHLSTQNFRQADEETRRLLIVLAGEAAQKRGYVFFSEVQFISETDLKTIDELWRQYSNNKFGYSVQKRISEKVNKDFSTLFLKLGWMKKLDTEIEQYYYRSFPSEFIWELEDDTPEGHLPLTNALRGTQLLNSILNHPAFDAVDEEEEEEGFEDKSSNNGTVKVSKEDTLSSNSKPLSDSVFKPDYSF